MALKIFQKLFKKKSKGHIVLTPEEAYAPLTQESEENAEASAPVFIPDFAAENKTEEPKAEINAHKEEPPKEEPAEKKQSPINIWMYGCLEDPTTAKTQIRNGMISAFRSVSEDSCGFTCSVQSGASVSVVIYPDVKYVNEQAGYLMMRYRDAYPENRDVLNAAMMQMELFNALAVYTMNPPYTQDDADALLSAVYAIALPVHAFVVNGRMELYRWDKRLVIAPDGRTDFTVFMPIKRSAAPGHREEADSADAARRTRNMEVLKKHGIEMPADMPVQVTEADARLRTPEEIVGRLASLLACALKAQAYTSPREISAPAAWTMNAVKRLDTQYGVNRLFTRKEAEYIVRGREQQHPAFLLRFESCTVLLWALGLVNMGWPDEACDTHSILRILRDADTEMLLKIAKPRPLNVILNMHDITYRLHSICVRCDEETQKAYSIDPDVVYERHYALNWLIAANGISDWDLVVPKT